VISPVFGDMTRKARAARVKKSLLEGVLRAHPWFGELRLPEDVDNA